VAVHEHKEPAFDPGFRLHQELLNLVDEGQDSDIDLLFVHPEDYHLVCRSRIAVGFLVFEATIWPQIWLAHAQAYLHRAIVPSSFCKRTLINSGFDLEKIDIIPHGIDPAIYNAEHQVASKPDSDFHVLFVGTPSRRKGIDIFLRSLPKAFPNGSRVRVTIKTSEWEPREDMVLDWKSEVHKLREIGFKIRTITRDISEQGMAKIYQSADLLCSPHRGEGFGLVILEAMACNTAVLTTGWSGPLDFVDSNSAFLINRFSHCKVEGLLPENFYRNDSAVKNLATMVEPDLDEVVECLRFAAKNREYIDGLTTLASRKARDLNWDVAASALGYSLLSAYQNTT
jgi:glycosyltransferase involved in cell wall biosynthesis